MSKNNVMTEIDEMNLPRFGVNYTPSKDWFYSWLDVDFASTERDLKTIADLGMDHVRILPLWPVLQPNRSLLNKKALADLKHTVQIAGDNGLDAYVDVLQGHLSSFDFVPSWLSSWHLGNMFTDGPAIAAQADLVAAIHETLADLPSFRGLTLGNELNQFSGAPHPSPMAATVEDIDNWLATLLAAATTDNLDSAQRRIALHAEYDAVWYLDGHPFLPRHASRVGDVTAIHSWVFNGTAQHYGELSPQSLRHGEYLIELSKAFATDPNRPVWLQEIGAPENVMSEAQIIPFAEASIQYAADTTDLWGITWWCSHDVDPKLADFPPFEHTLGLIDSNNRIKPLGRRFAELAMEIRGRKPPARRTTAVVIPVDDQDTPVSRAALGPGGTIFEAWIRAAEAGDRPALVTSNTANSPAALARLGINSVQWVEPGGKTAYTSVSDDAFQEIGQ